MDIASKIKLLKEEVQKMDDEKISIEARIKELQGLVAEKKRKEALLEQLKKQEAELLASM